MYDCMRHTNVYTHIYTICDILCVWILSSRVEHGRHIIVLSVVCTNGASFNGCKYKLCAFVKGKHNLLLKCTEYIAVNETFIFHKVI